jgi:CheY-like chemotaxis protein
VDWSLDFERDGENVWIISTVKDSGIGIKKEDLQKLFSDYNQVDTKSNRTIEGTGLGLSITKRIVEMMGGKIEVQSTYMEGSTFTVRMRQDFINDKVLGKKLADSLMAFTYTEKKRDKSQKMVRAQIPYARVLIVDDVSTNLDVARGIMKPYGMTIDCVTSGQAAIDRIRGEAVRYDAIFMDHMMPEMDGIEATTIIREKIGTEYAKNIPIIALTANAIVGTDKMFLASGFQDFLSKPIDIIKMDEVINTWIRDKDREKELGLVADALEDSSNASSGTPVMTTAIFKDARIDGLDIEEGLTRFSGDEDAYISVLLSYAQNTAPLIDTLRDLTSESLPQFAVTVHGIKGSSFSVSANAVGKQAERLEHAAKAGDLAFVSKTVGGFITDVETLLSQLNGFLTQTQASAEAGKAALGEPDFQVLTDLAQACTTYQMDEIDELLAELRHYRYESGGELVDWIEEELVRGEFSSVADKLMDMQYTR